MSKRLANEKEIEKNRIENKWKTVITLVSTLNVKNAGGALNSGKITFSYKCHQMVLSITIYIYSSLIIHIFYKEP